MFTRQKDPTQVPVQLNFKVPWQMREDLAAIAAQRGVSLNQLVKEAVMRGLKDELTLVARERTREAGATK